MSTLSSLLLCAMAIIGPLFCFWLGFEKGTRHSTKIWVERWTLMQQHAEYWYDRAFHLRAKLDALEQKRHDDGEGWKKD